jgi:hypothetical protein
MMFTSEELIGFLCMLVLIAGIGFVSGMEYSNAGHKRELIQRGLAEFVVDKDGNVEFRWKEAKP